MIFNNVLNTIYEKDLETQMVLLEEMRKIRKLPSTKIFTDNKMFVVLDDDYLPSLVGDYITDESLGLYKRDECLGKYKLWLPVYDFEDNVVGFAWYSDGSIEKEMELTHIKYRFQVGTFIKTRYLNIRRQTMISAMEEGYLSICDGFFDKYHLEHYGILSTSTYGSNLDEYKQLFLSTVKHLFFFMDNDEAGFKLGNQVAELSSKTGALTTVIKQTVGKDIDDYLKASPLHGPYLKKVIDELRKEPPPCGEYMLQSLC